MALIVYVDNVLITGTCEEEIMYVAGFFYILNLQSQILDMSNTSLVLRLHSLLMEHILIKGSMC